MTEVLDQVRRIVDATTLPVIADIDTGYGNPINVFRTVKEFSKAGVAAVQLEDQVSPKKCGHFNNKSIIPKEEMIYKIQAALDADPDLVLIARTDARATNGIEEALERANAYYEAGATVTFVEAPESEDEMERIPREVPCYQVANIVENGLTPHVSNKDLLQMGYSIALYANLTMRAAIFGAQMALNHLDEHGETKTFLDRMITMKERNRLTRLTEIEKMELKYGIR
jgi:2-methylisocitrate lyase-like PEP mutase family enzyme